MVSRHRTRSYGSVTGRYRTSPILPWTDRTITPLVSETCDDIVGNRLGVNTFSLSYTRKRPVTASFWGPTPNPAHYWDNYPCVPSRVVSGVSLPTAPSTSAAAATLVARTNPSRPSVLLPTFIFELRELPDLVRKLGVGALKGAADLNLRYQFGIRPFLSDLKKLILFQAATERKLQELVSLRRNGGLRSRYTIAHDVATRVDAKTLIQSSPTSLYRQSSVTTTRRIWGSARWVPSELLRHTDSSDMASLSRKLVLGLHHSQVTLNVWEALPWSWLVDWFTNTGDLLTGSNNSIAHTVGSCCIMIHNETEDRGAITGEALTGGRRLVLSDNVDVIVVGSKNRYLAAPGFTATLPLLTGRQLSILGSLAAMRYRH